MTGLFDQFRDEESGSSGEMVEERPPDAEQNNESVVQEAEEEYQPSSEETTPQTEYSTAESNENIGISSLMNKRAKLEEVPLVARAKRITQTHLFQYFQRYIMMHPIPLLMAQNLISCSNPMKSSLLGIRK